MKKLTMNMVALGNLRHRKKRYVTLFISIVLAMTFAASAPLFISSMETSRRAMKIDQVGKQTDITFGAQNEDWEEAAFFCDGEVGFAHSILYGWTEEQDRGTPIAWMDDRARFLYHETVKEGRWPEAAGEITVELGALVRMGCETELGTEITIHAESPDGRPMEDRSFTLVGILPDHRSNLERRENDESLKNLPAAFVSPEEPGSGYEDMTAFYNSFRFQELSPEAREKLEDGFQLPSTYVGTGVSYNSTLDAVMRTVGVSTVLSGLVAFLCCCGIANAFAGNLQERKTQIGMLRAIGATKRQIVRLFGKEAMILCLVSVPLSLGLAYGGVKLFSLLMGETFVFAPDWRFVLAGVAVSVLCVLLSAIVPLLIIARISPMQAIRDVEKMRKMRKRCIRSQKSFRVPRLLAKRKLIFTRGRQTLVGLILTLAVAVSCVFAGMFREVMEPQFSDDPSDYRVALGSWHGAGNPYINDPYLNPEISESMLQGVLSLPGVAGVSGKTDLFSVNLLREEMEDYFLLYGWFNTPMYMSQLDYGTELTLDALRKSYRQADDPEMQKFTEELGYTQEYIHLTVSARTEDRLSELEEYLIEGSINPEKLSSGEEILLTGPREIGAYLEHHENGGWSSGILDLSENRDSNAYYRRYMEHISATAVRPLEVGDTLTLSMMTMDENGLVTRKDRNVKIGGFLSRDLRGGQMGMFTTIDGLRTWYPQAGYDKIDIRLQGEIDEERNRETEQLLENLFPGFYVESKYTDTQQAMVAIRAFIMAFLTAMVTLVAASSWLINNGITAQLRQDTRSIGTLRALGAQPGEMVQSYLLQILTVIFWASLAGFVISIGWWLFYWQYAYSGGTYRPPLVLWPGLVTVLATLVLCVGNLWIQIRKISRRSIVENIREL